MFHPVKEGLNHYEILGVTSSATGDDIEEAFVTRAKMPITDDYRLKLRAAYKTLRDPFWRRIYDAELGIGSEPRPEPATRHPLRPPAEERIAPFIAASLRQPAGQAEHPASPEFIFFQDAGEAESTVDESPESFVADVAPGHADAFETRGRWSERNRAGIAAGVAVLGLGFATLLIGLWADFDRSPKTARAPASARVEQTSSRSGILTQTAPEQATPIKEESVAFPAPTTVAPVEAGAVDPIPVDGPAMGDRAQLPRADDAANTPIAEQQESTTVTSSADPSAPATGAASASSAGSSTAAPLTVAPPPAVAQSPPAAVAQAVSPPPAVRSPAVVNRAAAPKWIGGGPVKSDNPRGRFRGTVTVRFTVQPNGRVSGCRAAVSSGNIALDARTCQLVEQRMRFRPALDWQGRAIPYETRAVYTWGVKHRSLLDRLFKPGPG